MPEMGRYLKAYPVERFREFPQWTLLAREPADRPYLYLQENYTVTSNIFLNEDLVFDSVTDDWMDFCKQKLGFVVPSLPAMKVEGEPA